MTRKFLMTVALILAAGLAGCGTGPGLTGNDTGGIIPWSPENEAVAPEWATAHCARYRKIARLRPIFARDGEYIAFTCRFPPGNFDYGY
jgi:hypothetical protein